MAGGAFGSTSLAVPSMGESGGGDSLMRVFEEQIRDSLKTLAPEIEADIKITDGWQNFIPNTVTK